MNFEEYKRKLIEEDECERLAELQTKYYGSQIIRMKVNNYLLSSLLLYIKNNKGAQI